MKRICEVTNGYEIVLSNGKRHEYRDISSIRYTDRDSSRISHDEWDKFISWVEYVTNRRETTKRNKQCIKLRTIYKGYPQMVTLYKDQFTRGIITQDVYEIDMGNVTMRYLIDNLSAEELVEYLNDKGLSLK